MLLSNQSPSVRDYAGTLRASPAVREAIERYKRTGIYRPEDLRKILGDPSAGVEYGPGVMHKWLNPGEKK